MFSLEKYESVHGVARSAGVSVFVPVCVAVGPDGCTTWIKRGATLRPSHDTPLWNALVSLVGPRLRRRGARTLLARELGLHRARVGEYFKRTSAMPDAERTLRLLVWLSRQPLEKPDAVF